MRNVRKKPNFLDTKIIPFLKRYGIFLIVLFLAFPYVYKYLKRSIESVKNTNLEAKAEENRNENGKADPIIIKAKVKEIRKAYPNVSDKRMQEIATGAQKIAFALGTNVEDNHILFSGTMEVFNVAAWSEDEKAVIKELKKFTGTFPILEELYYKTATRSRNLKNDLLRYLSATDVKNMSNFYKKMGYNWL